MLGLVTSLLNATEVTIGAGDQTARVPVDMYWKNSLFECLYYPDELGFASGTISGIKFYNNFATDLPNKPVKIWLGETTQTSLSTYIPSTQLSLVFDGTVNFPTGQNTISITFTTPYMYNGQNLVMMVNRPMDTEYFSSSDYFLAQTIGNNRALNNQSDSTTYDPAAPPATPTVSGQFPKTTFVYTGQAITNDLGCLSISGNTTPSAQSPTTYVVTIKNNGANPQTNYTVKLYKEGDIEVASAAGVAIQPQATMPFNLVWTPTATGPTYLYGKVILTGDEIAANNQTGNYPVVVQAAGIVAVTVGAGGSTGRMPVDMFYKNSLFETLYLSTELNIGGLLTGIQFYNSFATNLPNMPTNIWVGETTQTDLSAGWIPSTQLTAVFSGNVNYPSGSNNINIPFTTPFPYGGGNLVVMVQRPMDAEYYSSSDVFVTQTGTLSTRTRNAYSDSTPFDPTAPPTATPTGVFPKTTLFFITEGMGSLQGTVTVGGTPLEGASVTVANSTLNYTTGANGTYSFPYIAEGAQTVSATKHGYNVVTHPVTIVEDQTTTQNFALTLLPQVTVTGRIVGSDNPNVGIADATITLSGYEPYTATTNATGYFTINNVFASQTYNYVASATGYQDATGTAVVGTTNLNMGTITVNEMAFPPFGVVATEAANFSNVTVNWQAPNPGAQGITETFEGTTFPPTDWSQIITDTGAAGTTGVMPTWCRVGTVALTPPVPAHGGEFQAAMWWSYAHQDEWLITPQFACPPSGQLSFWSYVYLGSTNSDHYYIKVSTDNGTTWTPLWDATAQTGGWNYYATPITVDISAYAGQNIKLAWHADDPDSSSDGMWYCWFVDDVSIATPTGVLKFSADELVAASQASSEAKMVYPTLPASRARVENPKISEPALSVATNNDRTLLGYKVWRLLAANQGNEAQWTSLTANPITPLTYVDNAWQPLPSGVYKFAVKAVYTNNVMSTPAFSNEIHKGMMGTLTGTVTEFGTNVPVAGATITAGDYSGVSNAQGVYSFGVYAGTYNVTCAKPSYQTATQAGVVITGMQTTTQNFVLTEITLPPGAVQAVEASPSLVNVTWMEPGSGTDISEGFEGTAFPPTDWTQIINNTGAAGTTGVYPTWCQVGEVALTPAVPPHTGAYQAALWWDYAHQDEWLITPEFICPPAADLNFWTYVYLGSTNLDHYNVKVSTDGTTWTTLWDATALTGGWNYYDTPIAVDLDSYAGQEIKLAWQAVDGDGQGLWYVWFLDDIVVGNPTTTLRFPASSLTRVSAAGNDHRAPETVMPKRPISREMMHSSGLTSANKVANETVVRDDRVLNGYKVWRLLQGQENNESAWVQLTPDLITATAWQDGGWGSVPDGNYKWAVKAIYTAGATSTPSFSDVVPKQTQIGTIAGIVRNTQNQAISGATVTCGTVTATTNASGAYSMSVLAGTHSVTASHPNYNPVTQNGVIVVTGQTTTVNFQLPASSNLLNDGFETYADFATTFAPWTNIDVDQSTTYTMQNVTWPGSGAAMAFMVFNPTTTTPPITTFTAHGGTKMAVAIASQTPPNNDWLITPQLNGASQIKFWARSLTAEYGLERFKVGVSTTGTNPDNFTIISGTNYIQAPVDWTEYIYNIPASRVPVYIGIQCVSNDAWFFMVDDVRVNGSDGDDPVVPVVATELKNNFPNPFNPETTIAYSVKEASPVNIEIYNVKGQLVKTLVNEVQEAGNHSIVWKGTDNNGRSVSSGIYYYKMTAGKFSSTKKMIMMK